MTRQQLAQDRLHCWSLIQRAERVGFPVPAKWLRHGRPPGLLDQQIELLHGVRFSERVSAAFHQDSVLYRALRP